MPIRFPQGWSAERLSYATAWGLERARGFLEGHAKGAAGMTVSQSHGRPWTDRGLSPAEAHAMGVAEGLAASARRRGSEALASATPEDMTAMARHWQSEGTFRAADADWTYVENFDIANLSDLVRVEGGGGSNPWLEWFRNECLDAMDEEREGYGNLLVEDVEEAIVIGFGADGDIEVWDGWHRLGATIVKGETTIRTLMGTLKPSMTPSP